MNRILVLTGYDDAMAEVGDLCAPSRVAYAERRGYSYHCCRKYEPGSHPSWQKIRLLRDLLPGHEAVLWLDADTMVTNPEISVEGLAADDRHLLYVSRDWTTCSAADEPHHFSMGNFLLRNTPTTFAVLDLIESRAEWANVSLWEQSAIQAEHRENPALRRVVRVMPRRVLNSVPYPDAVEPWAPGDFLAHFTGIANHIRVELIQQMIARLS
jgi:hypothetical protein